MRHITASQLATRLESAKLFLLDVREPWEFEICHIDGSINVPMTQISKRLDSFKDADEIVVICHHGIRSQQVIGLLQPQLGDVLVNLDGGVDAWAHEVDQDMPLY